MTDIREIFGQYWGDRTTGRAKNTFLTTRNLLLFLIALILIGIVGYLLFKPQNSTPAEFKSDVEEIKKPVTDYGPTLTLAALNEPYTGKMGTLRLMDILCSQQKQAAGFKGSFESFLGSKGYRLYLTVPEQLQNLTIVNTKGEKLFSSWESVFDGAGGIFPSDARFYSFNGKNVLNDTTWPEKIVWHGSDPKGNIAMSDSCDRWSSEEPYDQGLASSLNTSKILSQEKVPCNRRLIVFCIQKSVPSP